MRTIAVVNQKGGAGKTTTSVQLAAGLAERGWRVVACDMDAQANLTGTLMGEAEQPKYAPTMYELLTGEASVDEVMVACRRCDLIPASRHNKRLSIIDAAIGDMPNKLYHLREALLAVAGRYDFAVIDTPPARDTLAYNALTAADGAVIPAEAAEYSLDGIADLADSIEMTRRYTNPDLAIIGILMTQHRGQTRVARGMAANASEMASALGTRVFPKPIREAAAIVESQARYTDIFDYAPESGVAGDYRSFVDEVVGFFKKEDEHAQ